MRTAIINRPVIEQAAAPLHHDLLAEKLLALVARLPHNRNLVTHTVVLGIALAFLIAVVLS